MFFFSIYITIITVFIVSYSFANVNFDTLKIKSCVTKIGSIAHKHSVEMCQLLKSKHICFYIYVK